MLKVYTSFVGEYISGVHASSIGIMDQVELFKTLVANAATCGFHDMAENLDTSSSVGIMLDSYCAAALRLEKESGLLDWRSFTNLKSIDFATTIGVPKSTFIVDSATPVFTKVKVFQITDDQIPMMAERNIPIKEMGRHTIKLKLVFVSEKIEKEDPELVTWLSLIAKADDVMTLVSPSHPDSAMVHPLIRISYFNENVVIGEHTITTDEMML